MTDGAPRGAPPAGRGTREGRTEDERIEGERAREARSGGEPFGEGRGDGERIGPDDWEGARIILNPSAGPADADGWREALAGLRGVEVRETGGPGAAGEEAARALSDGVELLVAAGGDGTINEVLNGLAGGFDRLRFGVLPLGTANDLARSLGLPLDPAEAAVALRRARVRRADVIRVGGPAERFYLNASVGGFGGRVSEEVDSEKKKTWGPLAYLRTAAQELPEMTPHRLTAEIDGETLDLPTHHAVVANGRRVGGGIRVAPRARLDDGLADVVLLRAVRGPEHLLLASKVLLGKHLEDESVVFRRGSRISLRSEPPMHFNVDGEPVGEDPITFEVLPGALSVLCGEEKGAAWDEEPDGT